LKAFIPLKIPSNQPTRKVLQSRSELSRRDGPVVNGSFKSKGPSEAFQDTGDSKCRYLLANIS